MTQLHKLRLAFRIVKVVRGVGLSSNSTCLALGDSVDNIVADQFTAGVWREANYAVDVTQVKLQNARQTKG